MAFSEEEITFTNDEGLSTYTNKLSNLQSVGLADDKGN